jgi:NTE family protein
MTAGQLESAPSRSPWVAESMRNLARPRIALALGSGGTKGIAHIGVLHAFEEAEIRPSVYAGSSAGALVAAAAAQGISRSEMEAIADRLGRNPLFQIDYLGLLRRGVHTRALYREAPLRALCAELYADTTFRELERPLVVSTVDVQTGAPLCWGVESLPDVSVADAVYASCAMPGLLPPGRVGGRLCIDGAVLDPLGVRAVAPLADVIIAVRLEETSAPHEGMVSLSAAPTLWSRAHSIVLREVERQMLARWEGPPLFVLRIELPKAHPVRGRDPQAVIRAGYETAWKAISRWEGMGMAVAGVHDLS